MHPDSLRKAGMGVKLVSEAGMIRVATPTNDAPDTNAEKSVPSSLELQKLRDMRRELNEHYRIEARSELLRESVREAVRGLQPMQIQAAPNRDTDGRKSLVLGISDMHYGAQWRILGLKREVLNAYSPEIFEERMSV